MFQFMLFIYYVNISKKDVRSNKIATKYLFMGKISFSIMTHDFSYIVYGRRDGTLRNSE